MNSLILTIGLPRSGKSTWAKSMDFPVVNPDSIRLAIHGQAFYTDAEPLVWAIAKIMVDALFKAGHSVVIVDATNGTTKRRDFWKSDKWEIAYKYFDTSKEECIERAKNCGREDLIPVIERMAAEFELEDKQ